MRDVADRGQALAERIDQAEGSPTASDVAKVLLMSSLSAAETTLIILERPADKLPQDFVDWWNNQDLQNRVLVLTADPNAVTTLRLSAPAYPRNREAQTRAGRCALTGFS